MGNQPSSSGQRSSPQSPIDGRLGRHAASLQPGGARDFNPRRRGSLQPEGLTQKTAAPPSASLHTATTPAVQSSKGGTDVVTSALRAAQDLALQSQQQQPQTSDARMGAEQSRHRREPRDKDKEREKERERERERDREHPQHPPPPSEKPSAPKPPAPSPQAQSQPRDVPTPAHVPATAQQQQQQQQLNDAAALSNSNGKPRGEALSPSDMAVPAAPVEPLAPRIMAIPPSSPTPDYFLPAEPLFRPPRLPLPIEEEVHTPGSPIISPQDAQALDIIGEGPEDVRRAASMLSNTTLDEDELGDDLPGPQNVPTVPTLIEWEGPGERVYVTGTFVEWNRKFRLHRNGPSKKPNVLSATVNITPGTHHLKFIVDDNMTTSDTLPTAVDYTNILVNYLEVSLDDLPGTTATEAAAKVPQPPPVTELRAPPGVYPPQTLPPTPELIATQVPQAPAPTAHPVVPMPEATTGRYTSKIPRYLLDLDAPEESSRFHRANMVTASGESLPHPPTLPMFLNKPVLNSPTPMKDDSSVLNLPNHTVLNHLATSSIRDGILATSATTRYKQKFLTTIMYKPKGEEAEAH